MGTIHGLGQALSELSDWEYFIYIGGPSETISGLAAYVHYATVLGPLRMEDGPFCRPGLICAESPQAIETFEKAGVNSFFFFLELYEILLLAGV